MQVSCLWFWISVWLLGWVATFWFGLLARGFFSVCECLWFDVGGFICFRGFLGLWIWLVWDWLGSLG